MTPDLPARAFDVRVTSDSGQMVLVRGVDAYEIDEVGAVIWDACNGNNSVGEIAGRLTEEYEVDRATAEADVGKFLLSLREAGLVD